MMMSPVIGPNLRSATLVELLDLAARRASTRTLVTLLSVGGVGAIALLLLPHRAWVLAALCALPAAFGGWALARREAAALQAVDGTRPERLLLLTLAALSIGVGVAAFVVVIYAITFFLAGPAPVL